MNTDLLQKNCILKEQDRKILLVKKFGHWKCVYKTFGNAYTIINKEERVFIMESRTKREVAVCAVVIIFDFNDLIMGCIPGI